MPIHSPNSGIGNSGWIEWWSASILCCRCVCLSTELKSTSLLSPRKPIPYFFKSHQISCDSTLGLISLGLGLLSLLCSPFSAIMETRTGSIDPCVWVIAFVCGDTTMGKTIFFPLTFQWLSFKGERTEHIGQHNRMFTIRTFSENLDCDLCTTFFYPQASGCHRHSL